MKKVIVIENRRDYCWEEMEKGRKREEKRKEKQNKVKLLSSLFLFITEVIPKAIS
tara:strand:+ start:102 stop:266 length:165 start_codon:yes stop_codon:yes gene_type:complete